MTSRFELATFPLEAEPLVALKMMNDRSTITGRQAGVLQFSGSAVKYATAASATLTVTIEAVL
jgi:hypothetical protein